MSPVTRHSSPRTAGVALIVTVILVSVITFMAITFLALSRREKGAVTTTTDQATAKFAAEAALERAKAELLAPILAATNAHDFGLLVSTNFINRSGYLSGVNDPTNVNYDAAAALNNLDEQRRNIANLFYNPSPPVFVVTNRALPDNNEFRFYLDLNRNGRHDPNGVWPVVTNELGDFATVNGVIVSNFFVGDPEWIGQLVRPDLPHSASNRFTSRYAYLVLPAGKTLDVNYIHNQAFNPDKAVLDQYGREFYRNQGVGAWEINLAAFLYDLNTNAWGDVPPFVFTNLGGFLSGNAFADAGELYRYRLNGPRRGNAADYAYDINRLFSANTELGAPAIFSSDYVDGYSAGPLMVNYHSLTIDSDTAVRMDRPWPGSGTSDHFFTSQDFFDRSKTASPSAGPTFPDRLWSAGTNLSSYDRYTFYRMLSQLGTDSAPEPDTKLNLNYINVGGFKATNFISWNDPDLVVGNAARGIPALGRPGSEIFFTNAVDRLLKRYSVDWLERDRPNNYANYIATFGTNGPFGAGDIPVFVNGRFAYTPAVHRLLQLAANLYDTVNPRNDVYGALPTVFRPVFKKNVKINGPNTDTDIYVQDFVEVTNWSNLAGLTLTNLNTADAVVGVEPNDLIFGVPLVIGARKGLPNFNEFAAETVVQITRKVELRKVDRARINQTNQMFIIGISNVFGSEFWNSYTTHYRRPVDIIATNFCELSLTNDYGFAYHANLTPGGQISTNFWAARNPRDTKGGASSFLVPLRYNHVIVPDQVYRLQRAGRFDNLTSTFERPSGFAFPRFGLTVTNRLLAIIKEQGPTGRILDYVQLNDLIAYRDLTAEIAQPPASLAELGGEAAFNAVWATNSLDGVHLLDRLGIIQQIEISKGNVESGANWQNYGLNQPSGATKAQAIAYFLAFFSPNLQATYVDPVTRLSYSAVNTSLVANVPFTPTSKRSVPMVWQANDPLVHFTAGDLEYLERSGSVRKWEPPSTNHATIVNLGVLNERYRPWGGNPKVAGNINADPLAFQTVVKDPGAISSDAWQFPTNKLPALGWLGRVHRGTPWQTVYLKSVRVADAVQREVMQAGDWRNWTGNRNLFTVALTQPETDRGIFDLFTTAFNDNAGRGQLSVNQTGLAAWSAVLGGIVVLSNSVPDDQVANGQAFAPLVVEPAGAYDPANSNTWPAVVKIVEGINRTRANTNLFVRGAFERLGDVLATPELTVASPFLNHGVQDDDGHNAQLEKGLNDGVYEWLPQQMLSLVRLGETRFVVYAYGQTLRPAPGAMVMSGPFNGMVTNYQITAEVAARAVVRVEGSPDPYYVNDAVNPYPDPRGRWRIDPNGPYPPPSFYPPRIVVESYNILPPD